MEKKSRKVTNAWVLQCGLFDNFIRSSWNFEISEGQGERENPSTPYYQILGDYAYL